MQEQPENMFPGNERGCDVNVAIVLQLLQSEIFSVLQNISCIRCISAVADYIHTRCFLKAQALINICFYNVITFTIDHVQAQKPEATLVEETLLTHSLPASLKARLPRKRIISSSRGIYI